MSIRLIVLTLLLPEVLFAQPSTEHSLSAFMENNLSVRATVPRKLAAV